MTFHYDKAGRKVVDNETLAEIFQKGQQEVNLWRFVFFDPRSTVRSGLGPVSGFGPGEVAFYVSPIHRVEKVTTQDGVTITNILLLGVKIDRRTLAASFERYVKSDARTFDSVCDLIRRGFREWFLARDGIEEAAVLIE
ncbi:MAG: hypothetical protein KGO48_13515 [Alphaproteobacteria bacterium]|nr:hypothetical protein [Alphaproteobacteria bacterium]